MQNQASAPRWYFYHEENGQMVMDRADHTDHLAQAHRKLGKPRPRYIHGHRKPLSDELAKQYADSRGLKLNLSPRPVLPAFEEAPGVAERRAKNAALHAARAAGK